MIRDWNYLMYGTGEIYGVNGGLTQIQVDMPPANL